MSWKLCSSCKNPIQYRATYWVCSVSTCTRKRTGLFFCSVACWEVHLPTLRHREAWAVEEQAPSEEEWKRQLAADDSLSAPASSSKTVASSGEAERRTISPVKSVSGDDLPRDILVVVSKLKKYIKLRSGLNTSDSVMSVLSDEIRRICDQAIKVSVQRDRKTILDRDLRDALKGDR